MSWAAVWPDLVHLQMVGPKLEAFCCRAYKLGKGRQSYNMLNVQLYDANNVTRRLEATHAARVTSQEPTMSLYPVYGFMISLLLTIMEHSIMPRMLDV